MAIQVETQEQVFDAQSLALDPERVDLVIVTRAGRYPGEVLRLKFSAVKRVIVTDPALGQMATMDVVAKDRRCPTCGRP